MNEFETISFEHIPPTKESAKRIQDLAFQNYEAGDLELARFLSQPHHSALAPNVRRRLASPPAYREHLGVYRQGRLEGYMETGEWRIEDEAPFAYDQARVRLRELENAGMVIDPNRKLGIFGLAIDQSLKANLYDAIADRFLDTAVDRGQSLGMKAVVATFHDNDQIQPIARHHGFEFVGRIGEANGVPGITQRLYRKPLDS